MEKGLIFDSKPDKIEDLGSGYSNVHLNIREVTITEHDEESNMDKEVKKWQADVQRVQNPVTYDKTVDAAIHDEFPNGEAEAALRKGILDPKNKDFVALNEFAEFVKRSYKD